MVGKTKKGKKASEEKPGFKRFCQIMELACAGIAKMFSEIKTLTLKVVEGKDSYILLDKKKSIVIGIVPEEYEHMTIKENRINCVFKTLHESSHALFTSPQKMLPMIENVAKYWVEYLNKQGLVFRTGGKCSQEQLAKEIAHDIMNCLEDGRIENLGCRLSSFMLKIRNWFRVREWGEYSISENIDKYSFMRNSILTMATTGLFSKGYDSLPDSFNDDKDAFESIINSISNYVQAVDVTTAEDDVMKIAEVLAPYIAEVFGCKPEEEEELEKMNAELMDLIKKIMEEVKNSEVNYGSYEEEGKRKSKEMSGTGGKVQIISIGDPEKVPDARKTFVPNPTKSEKSSEKGTPSGAGESSGEEAPSGTEKSSQKGGTSSGTGISSKQDSTSGEVPQDGAFASGSRCSESEDTSEEAEDGEAKDGESGESKNGETGEAKDGESGETKDGESGETKDGESGESKDGESGESKDGEDEEVENSEAEETKIGEFGNPTGATTKETKSSRVEFPKEEETERRRRDVEIPVKEILKKVNDEISSEDTLISGSYRKFEQTIDKAEVENNSTLTAKNREVLRSHGFPKYHPNDVEITRYVHNYEDKKGIKTPENLASIARKIRRSIEEYLEKNKKHPRRGVYSGRVDAGRLSRFVLGEGDFFRTNGSEGNIDQIECLILVDNSGSMRGTKTSMVMDALMVIEEAFKGLISFSIETFSYKFYSDEEVHRVIKDWDQTYEDRSCSAMYKKYFLETDENNYDAFAIALGAMELLNRPGEKKMMIVLSDGLPECSRQESSKESVTRAVRFARSQGIFLASFFFGPDDFIKSSWDEYKEMYENFFFGCTTDSLEKHLSKLMRAFVENNS